MPRQTFSASFCPSLLSTVVLLPGPLLSSTVVSSLCSCRARLRLLFFFFLFHLSPLSSVSSFLLTYPPRRRPSAKVAAENFQDRSHPAISSLLFLHPLEEGLTSRRLISFTNRSQRIDVHRYSIALFSSPSFSLSLSLCIASPDCKLLRVVAARKERSDR